jgi:inorganic pyrophosphatase/exopolyphosphatase
MQSQPGAFIKFNKKPSNRLGCNAAVVERLIDLNPDNRTPQTTIDDAVIDHHSINQYRTPLGISIRRRQLLLDRRPILHLKN